MKKIKLEIETLEVASFETAARETGDKGTVLAYATRVGQNTCAQSCPIQNTCVQDCYWTLWESCNCPVVVETRLCDTVLC